MDVDKNEWRLLMRALDEWTSQGKLDSVKAAELRQSINLRRTDSQQIAQYFFIVAISCTILAFGAIFIDDKILEKLKSYFSLSNMVIALGCAALGTVWFWYLRRTKHNFGSFSYEVYMVMGALLLLSSLVYICKDAGFGAERNGFLAIATIMLFGLSVFFHSRVLWLAGIAALVGWFGAFTTWQSSNNLFLGMNYPTRFAVLSLLILGATHYINRYKKLEYVQRLTYISALLLFMMSMWMMSIFGNYGYLDEWAKVRQTQVLAYSFVFGVITGYIFYLGVKHRDDNTRDLAVLFLLLNLYSRYFEYFWDSTNKGIFFLILAVSFWVVGRWIEKRKRFRRREHKPIVH
ncbi:MAG: hypothetical protein EOP56_16690 [Sphingobacteriales bacterium]|nr:MAG: hypothetical protein EOP56_16690 [Sphingobacteriales bacterium]